MPGRIFISYSKADPEPTRALADFLTAQAIVAKLVVVSMVSNGFSIAAPNDGGTLDVVDFRRPTCRRDGRDRRFYLRLMQTRFRGLQRASPRPRGRGRL